MIRVVVAAPPHVSCPEDLALLPPAADWIELRLDLLDEDWTAGVLARWIAISPRPVLATLRSLSEGGRFGGTSAQAAHLLLAAAESGAQAIDVELDVACHLPVLPEGVEVVLSHHGDGDAAWPAQVARRAPAWRKLARAVPDGDAWRRLKAEAVAARGTNLSVLSYDALGSARGALEPKLLFGSAVAGQGVVPGQPGLVELLDDLRAGEVSPNAGLFGLLGDPPNRSPSPAVHNAVFRHLGLDALYVPMPGISPERALTLPFCGFSVTTPYKEEALRLADVAAPWARELGVANTLFRDAEGRWCADNTDAEAIACHLPEAEGATALVWGAGGYARAAVHVLRGEGFEPRIGARNEARGRALAEALDVAWAGTEPRRLASDRVLVNATPLGARGEASAPLDAWTFEELVVLDAPYARPGARTGLARIATTTAARLIDGLALLLAQALGQVERFTQGGAPVDVAALALARPLPLVLLGLRGAGKSTVGARVARQLGRPYLDLDEEVLRITGRSAAAWLCEDGEAAFRRVELQAVQRLVGRRGVVVAAGGGVLEHPAAAPLLEEHTWPVLLDLPPELAAARAKAQGTERPRLVPGASEEDEALQLHARRHAGWLRISHAVVDASRSIEVVTEAVARAYLEASLRGRR